MIDITKGFTLQLFADGGEGGGDGAAATGENASPAAEENRLRELGVPEAVLAKRAKRAGRKLSAPAQAAAVAQSPAPAKAEPDNAPDESQTKDAAAPSRMSWDEIMADPEYNKQMQATMQARLRSAKGAEEQLGKLAPAIELLSRKYGLDAANLDADALCKAISDDDAYYEDKAIEMGVSVETAKQLDQTERETKRQQAAQAKAEQDRMFTEHFAKLEQQGNELKRTFKNFDLAKELQNPAFARMTSPQIGISVEDAFYAVHRREIQQASMEAAAKKTAQQMSASIRAGQKRPVENGVSGQAPTNVKFDYANATPEQREALKKRIRMAAARGEKIYPGQM